MINALGLDLGASGIRAFTVGSEKPIAEVKLGPSAKDRETETILLINQLASELGDRNFESVCLGMSGFASLGVDPDSITKALENAFGSSQTIVTSDMATGHYSHFGENSGVVLVVGTGALAFGVSEAEICRIDGLGASLGDFGSAAWIGQQAMRQAKRLSELENDSFLLEALEKLLGDSTQWPKKLATGELSIFAIAATATVVAELASSGQKTSLAIMEHAGLHAAESAIACAKKLGISPVAYGGGVLRDPESIATATCIDSLTRAGLGAAPMMMEPGIGALNLASVIDSRRLELLIENGMAVMVKS